MWWLIRTRLRRMFDVLLTHRYNDNDRVELDTAVLMSVVLEMLCNRRRDIRQLNSM